MDKVFKGGAGGGLCLIIHLSYSTSRQTPDLYMIRLCDLAVVMKTCIIVIPLTSTTSQAKRKSERERYHLCTCCGICGSVITQNLRLISAVPSVFKAVGRSSS